MKFQNVSKKVKHIKVERKWLDVKPGEEFEILRPGRLHLDPELKQIVDKKKQEKVEDDNLARAETKKEIDAELEKPLEEEKEVVDVSDLDEKSKERVEDLKEDLKDDGKRNHSHKKKKRGLFGKKK